MYAEAPEVRGGGGAGKSVGGGGGKTLFCYFSFDTSRDLQMLLK